MNKRQKKKQLKKSPGYEEAEISAEEILKAYGKALGVIREKWATDLMEETE